MSASIDVAEKTLEDLEKEVTCAVCQDHYTDPKIFPCLHYYCKECILKLSFRKDKKEPLSCPECCKDTILPEEGVEGLKSAFFINRLKSMYFKHRKALSQEAQCEMCKSEGLAKAFCKQCSKLACENCVRVHTEMILLFEGHEIVPIDQVTKINTEEIIPPSTAPKKCSLHREAMKIFCFDCNKLICRDCTVKDHKNHNYEFNHLAADSKKKELLESLEPLREVKSSLSQALEEVHNIENAVEAQGDSVASTIETSFKELYTILNARKQQLLEEAKKRVREKAENLKGQEKSLSMASAGVCGVIDYTEQCVRHCSDDEIMSMHSEISNQIRQKVEEHRKQGNRLKPVEEADMGVEVRCAEDLQQLGLKAKITHLTDSIVVKNMPATAEVDKKITIQVINPNKDKKAKINFECTMECLSSASTTELEIEDTSDGYEISYTPSVRGEYELSISAYGQSVPGSPFTMTIYKSPMQLDMPFKVWGGVTRPFSLVVNSVGEIIVAEYQGDIIVLDSEGNRRGCIEHSKYHKSGFRSIAVDDEDNIYFVAYGSNKIGKANRSCDILLVHEIRVKQIKGQGFHDIAAVGDEIMVTERYNEGYIMVYDRELNYVREIPTRNNIAFKHLYPDCNGDLYISDEDNTIQVLSKTGDFIRSFSRIQNGVPQLKEPWMVHVCGQYVYVADYSLLKTVVFTTEGDHVTSIDCYGGICMAKNGILYIADHFHSRVASY